jgi:hypothetical protein
MDGCLYQGEAQTPGRLWLRPPLTPILEVPDAHTLPRGTANLLADAGLAGRACADPPSNQGPFVRGELYALPDPATQLARLDTLEDFIASDPHACTYDRRLGCVTHRGATLTAWLYPIPSHRSPADYLPCINPSDWRGEVELPADYFAARQRGETPPPPPPNAYDPDSHA